MTTRFGFGFERKSSKSPSSQFAQSFFLELFPRLRKDVVLSLFDVAFEPFSQFIIRHEAEIHSMERHIEPVLFPRDTAIRILVYSWSALRNQEDAEPVASALTKWSHKRNLIDEWCLNHAVLTLRELHLASNSASTRNPLSAWQGAIFAGLKCDSIFTQAEFHEEFRKQSLFEFNYAFEELSLTTEGPFWRPVTDFRREVLQKFQAIGGSAIRGARKALTYQLSHYLVKVEKIARTLNLEEPRVRWANEHFNWLINYQIPPCKRYREIGREFKRDEATIREGVQNVAAQMALTLRPSERGRPKGIQDTKPRHRAASG